MSKIEAGRVTLNPAPFDLHALLRGAAELFRFRAEARRLQLTCALDADVPRYVIGDESKLRQILINLLGNAVKFTHAGWVTLRAARQDRPPTTDHRPPTAPEDDRSSFVIRRSSLVVEVEDTGEGIAADHLPQ